jgi:hypothetical protein
MIKVVESRRHGKAVKGRKRTSTWQVRHYCLFGPNDYLLKKQITFIVGNEGSRTNAYAKALKFAEELRKKYESTNEETAP